MEWIVGIVVVLVWLYLGLIGSRRMKRYFVAEYPTLPWSHQNEMVARILILVGPIQLGISLIFRPSNNKPKKEWKSWL